MKISDQGFSERLPGQSQTSSVNSTSFSRGSVGQGSGSSSDSLQLSNLAAQLQKASAGDSSSRSTRLNEIAAAVKNNTFQIDFSRVSSAIVSEAVGGAR